MEEVKTATKLIIEQQQEKENVECVALEILILSDQKKNMKEICYLLWLNHNNNKI
jgi:hypothetical protein